MVNILKLKQIGQKTQCESVQFHLPCYKQPSLFISKTSKAWIVENSPFFTCCHVCTYLQLQSHMWYCIHYVNHYIQNSSFLSKNYEAFLPSTSLKINWKYDKTRESFNHTPNFLPFQTNKLVYWITLHGM